MLDISLQRAPFYVSSQAVFEECDKRGFQMFVACHGIATVFYLITKKHGEVISLQMIKDLLSWATVATVGQDEALAALGYGITDYEDALIAAAAVACEADCLITRDKAGFAKSLVPPIQPDTFLLGLAALS